MNGSPVVLVHGGRHGAWCWDPMLVHIQTPALAVDLPPKVLRNPATRFQWSPEMGQLTIRDLARSALADIDAAGLDHFVLVGHSMGGLTIAEIARLAPGRVAHLVFVSCNAPPEGASVVDVLPGLTGELVRELVERARRGEVDEPTPEEIARFMFCNDMTIAQTAFVLERIGLDAMQMLGEAVTRVGVPSSIPKTWVRLAADNTLAPEVQDEMIANLERVPGGPVEVVELDAGHDAMISRPAELAAIIDHIAGR